MISTRTFIFSNDDVTVEKLNPPNNCSSIPGLQKLAVPSLNAPTMQHRGEQNNVYLEFLNYKFHLQ